MKKSIIWFASGSGTMILGYLLYLMMKIIDPIDEYSGYLTALVTVFFSIPMCILGGLCIFLSVIFFVREKTRKNQKGEHHELEDTSHLENESPYEE